MYNFRVTINKITISSLCINYDPPKICYGGASLSRDDYPTVLQGENGSGKSTLTLALSGAIPAYVPAGITDFEFCAHANCGEIDLLQNRDLFQIVPQRASYGLLGFTPIDEINLVKVENIALKNQLIEYFEIPKLNDIPSSYLSDGEKKRLVICIALISEKPLIVTDEWTTHLDEYWVQKIEGAFDAYHKKGGFHLSFISKSHHNDVGKAYSLKTTFYPARRYNIVTREILDKYLDDFGRIAHRCDSRTRELSTVVNNPHSEKRRISVKVVSGEILGLIGANGSGKTTVLKSIWNKTNSRLKRAYYSRIKKELLPRAHLIPTDPVYHILGPTIEDEINRISSNSKLHRDLSLFVENILHLRTDDDVLSMSYGQRKVFALVLALVNDNDVVLIDEPMAGLDDFNVELVKELLKLSRAQGKIIIITNQVDLEYVTKKIFL